MIVSHFILFFICNVQGFTHIHNWFPVVPVSTYDFSKISKIEILNKEFVIWKKGDNYIVQDDRCPHRSAPLSEGYIDRDSKNLRCSYHGWEFNEGGCTVCIPQNDCKRKFDVSVPSYETCVYGDILWVFLGNKTDVVSEYSTNHPSKTGINNDTFTMMREIPYDYFILLENLCDPAHVPFAHHGLQSRREKGSPVHIQMKELNSTNYHIYFSDQVMGNGNETRVGTMNIHFPCHYYLENIHPKDSILDMLHVFTVPVRKGKSRIIIKTQYNISHPSFPLFSVIPKWIQHSLTNRFFDSDSLLLHEQERLLRKKNGGELYGYERQYKLMTESDLAIKKYTKWMKRVNNFTLPWFYEHAHVNKERKRREILGRLEQHTNSCKYCKNTLERSIFVQKSGIISSVWLGVWLQEPKIFSLGCLVWLITEKIKNVLIFEDYVHNEID